MDTSHKPVSIDLHQSTGILEIRFSDDTLAQLSCEYLRVFSPSAEVKGHGPSQEVLQTGKRQVAIHNIEPVGNYAIRLGFDDGHDTGIYSWNYLYQLHQYQSENWQDYLKRLETAGKTRDA